MTDTTITIVNCFGSFTRVQFKFTTNNTRTQHAHASVRWLPNLKLDPTYPNHCLILHFDESKSSIQGNQAPQLYSPFQFLHVYCNLSEPTYFNGKLVNSLRGFRLVQKKVDKYVRHIAAKLFRSEK